MNITASPNRSLTLILSPNQFPHPANAYSAPLSLETIHPGLLILFGTTAALVVGLMLIAMLSSTFMLVAIMKYDVKNRDRSYPTFQKFWSTRCESDWRFSFRAFNLGGS
ncbi:unnamed protein product [Discosporangium mesarthrocarpum]